MTDGPLDLEAKVGELLNAEGWPAVDAFLEQVAFADLTESQQELWFQYRAICAYRMGDRDLALSRYADAAANCPENGHPLNDPFIYS